MLGLEMTFGMILVRFCMVFYGSLKHIVGIWTSEFIFSYRPPSEQKRNKNKRNKFLIVHTVIQGSMVARRQDDHAGRQDDLGSS